MKERLKQAKEILKQYHQKHIIHRLKELETEKQEKMIEQILSIDFEELEELYELAGKPVDIELSELEPVAALNPKRLPKKVYDEFKTIGEEAVRRNILAVVILAGGQGTRLRS
ncbi:MAG: hypothetical protein FWC53_03915 [Firmicutes bacterium]|nr:hypothetical protein [Bacillota bacterium]